MSIPVRIPSVGESISEGRLVRWLKKDGDVVDLDEPLFELETEKATADVPSPAAGTLRIVVAEGQTVEIGSVVANIEEAAAAPAAGSPRPRAARGAARKRTGGTRRGEGRRANRRRKP